MTSEKDIHTPQLQLNQGVSNLFAIAHQEKERLNQEHLGLQHLLSSLLQTYGPMAERLVSGLNVETLRSKARALLKGGEIGTRIDTETLESKLSDRAKNRGAEVVSEQDFAELILEMSGYSISSDLAKNPIASSQNTNPTAQITARTALDRLAQNLSEEVSKGNISPVIGRSEEIGLIAETLCRETKRNPLLVGPPGVGKTAIIEGLARLIHEGAGPKALMSKKIYSIQPSSLIAASKGPVELLENMEAILEEASDTDVILFIDELHTVIGAGGIPGTDDIATLLKPSLARGKVACIGATTDDEYRRYVQRDKALERRFQPLMIREMSSEDTLLLLRKSNERSLAARDVEMSDEVLKWIVEFTHKYMKNRHFPDKALDLHDQIVANAKANNKAVDQLSAESVAQRIVGMPLGISTQLSKLREEMVRYCQLPEPSIDSICNRLNVTVRNLDVRNERADAVILLTDEAVEQANNTASLISKHLYGSEDRIVEIDFSQFTQPSDITQLLGAGPGWVGYQDTIPLHQISSMPWSVVLLSNIDLCHPVFRSIIQQALQNGFFTSSTGHKIYLSNAVVIMTCSVLSVASTEQSQGLLRFEQLVLETDKATDKKRGEQITDTDLTKYLTESFLDEVDVICSQNRSTADYGVSWVKTSLIPALQEVYKRKGTRLIFDGDAVALISRMAGDEDRRRRIERKVEEYVAQGLTNLGKSYRQSDDVSITVGVIDNKLDLHMT